MIFKIALTMKEEKNQTSFINPNCENFRGDPKVKVKMTVMGLLMPVVGLIKVSHLFTVG